LSSSGEANGKRLTTVDSTNIDGAEAVIQDVIRQSGEMDDFMDLLVRFVGLADQFPVLRGIQVGQPDWGDPFVMLKWMELEQGLVGSLIFRILHPRIWCQFRSAGYMAIHPPGL
jgi:hypothetical protein